MKSGDSQKKDNKTLNRRRILLVWSAVTFGFSTFIIQAGVPFTPGGYIERPARCNFTGNFS